MFSHSFIFYCRADSLYFVANGRTSGLFPPCHLPQSEDSGALGIYFTTLCKSTPLSYPGTDEEEELDVPPPVPTAEERMYMDEVEASPPLSCFRRQVTSLFVFKDDFVEPLPMIFLPRPSIPPPRKSTRIAHPGSASSIPFRKGKRKSKAIVELEDDSEMDVDNSQAVVAKPPLKNASKSRRLVSLV